jgi:hypothetical protein
MKLQYLGDWRDAFKWDLLHWLCTEASPEFSRLVFVPLLTPDDAEVVDGRIPPNRYAGRPFVQPFVEGLRRVPRELERVRQIGAQPEQRRFDLVIHGHDRHVPFGVSRAEYWRDFDWGHANSVVFIDPDNGFETKTRRSNKWVLHAEIERMVDKLPSSSAVVVYQHRPKLKAWSTVLPELTEKLSYVPFASATHDSTLAFVTVSKTAAMHERTFRATQNYARLYPQVKSVELCRSDG